MLKKLKDIELRMAAIKEELGQDGADLDALEKEVDELTQARGLILAEAEKRKKMLDSIATGTEGTAVRSFTDAVTGDAQQEERSVYDAPEYRSGWLKSLQGNTLTAAEQRAIASANVPGTIPTQTANEIIRKLKQYAPLLSEITLLHVEGNVTYAVEGVNKPAAIHTQNAAITASGDTTVQVTLGGYEIVKLITISQTVKTMAINAFETFIVDQLVENIGMSIEGYLVNGTGTSKPQGANTANTWGADNAITVGAAASLNAANVMDLIALLKGGYDRNAKFLMSKKTLWGDFMKLRDDAKYPLVQRDPVTNGWVILGYPVMLTDSMATHEAILGDFKKLVANLAQNINVATSEHSGFRNNSIDYRGSAIFDSKVALGEAFVKLAKAST